MKNRITMRDIADKLGVSSVTISKALSGKDGVSEDLRDKIIKLADEMGYRYNTLAKSMKDGYSYNIGVLVAERYTAELESFYLKFYQCISKVLESYKYYGILYNLSAEDENKRVLPRIYNENRVDGIIVLGQLKKSYINLLKEIDIPILFLDFYDHQSEIDTVITDNFYGSYMITNYLLNNGHEKIAFVGNIYSTSSIQDRFLGYYKALLENQIPVQEDYIINDRDQDGQFIEFNLPEKLPSAFVCNCDRVAYSLINFLKDQGYRVPDDCSVVGFDNDIYAKISSPPLTTIEVNMDEMSAGAVQLLIDKIKKKTPSVNRVQIPGKIILRDSVKRINKEQVDYK